MIRTVSYGGGVQSTALLVLAAQGHIDFPLFLFANTGDDSENPRTLAYVREIAAPYAASHGIELRELQRRGRGGKPQTLWGKIVRPGSRSLPLPIRMKNGAPGRRSCTADFKIEVVAREIRSRGATATYPAINAIGISLDEWTRMRTDSGFDYQHVVYPLVDMRLTRGDCVQIIERSGLPVPPKSACFFCPFHSLRAWRDLRDEQPELFERSVWLEQHLNRVRENIGKDRVYLTDAGAQRQQTLDQVIGTAEQLQLPMDTDSTCDLFSCMT